MGARFVPNPVGIRAMAHTPQMGVAMVRVGEEIEQRAKDRMPHESIAKTIKTVPIAHALGLGARVLVADWRGHFFEFGTVNMSPLPYLRPAAESVGGVGFRASGR